MTLIFCPLLDSPFESAKLSVLLLFGAAALLHGSAVCRQLFTGRTDAIKAGLLVWGLVAGLATLQSRDLTAAWRPLLAYAAAGSIALALMRVQVSRRMLVHCIALSTVMLSVLVLAGAFGLDLPRLLSGTAAPGRMKAAATLGNPLFVASFLSASIWSICALRGRSVMVRGLLLAVVVLAVAATGERTAVVAVTAGAACWFASSRRSHGDVRGGTAAVSAVIVIALAAWMFNPRTTGDALTGRLFLWRTSLHHAGLVGSGVGSFYRSYDENLREIAATMPGETMRYVAYETQAHNLLVQQVVENGLLGASALVLLIVCWFGSAWKRRALPEVRAALAGVAAYLVAACFDNPLSRPEGVLLPALLLMLPWLRGTEAREALDTSRETIPSRWLMPATAIVLLLAAVANAASSYAVFAGERAEQLAQMPDAERWLRRAIAIDAGSQDARFDLVRVLCESGDYRGCWLESEIALQWVNEAELHLLRVRALEAMGRDSLARRELDAARRQFPWSDELLREQFEGPVTE